MNSNSVSYTHLDVYKRQSLGHTICDHNKYTSLGHTISKVHYKILHRLRDAVRRKQKQLWAVGDRIGLSQP